MALKLDKRVYYVLAFLTVLFMFFIGSRSSPIILFVFAVCTGSMVFAIYLAKWVLAKDDKVVCFALLASTLNHFYF